MDVAPDVTETLMPNAASRRASIGDAGAKAPRVRIVFLEDRTNKQSVSALWGAIAESPAAPHVEVVISRQGRLPEPLAGTSPLAAPPVLAFSFQTPDAAAAAARVRTMRRRYAATRNPPVFLAGGPHATGDPEGTLRLGFDFLIAGEAEEARPALLLAMAERRPTDGVPGLCRREGDAVRLSPPAPPVDFEAAPPFPLGTGRYATLEISRGCPHGCAYCQTPSLMGRTMRHRSVDRILRYAEGAHRVGMKDLRFVTPNALAYGSADGRTPEPSRIEELLARAGAVFGREHVFFGSFPSEVRPESVTDETAALVKRLAANDNVVLGLQTGSDRMLRRIHRGHDADEVFRAVDVLLRHGFKTIVDFILGLPGETEEDRRATREAMEKLARKGAFVHTHFFMPLPGTPLGGEEPVPLDEEMRLFVERMGGASVQFGQWKTQERIARKAARFRRR
jgi:B12-binding domain/radical SAM domain protein